jgi:hypothetical protein
MRALLLATLLVSACAGDDTYLIVNVDRREAVHDAAKLKVTLSNAGTMLTKELDINDAMFPLTFSLSAPGRDGDLTIGIDAVDVMDTLVGRGSGTTTLTELTATVMIDSADFVVNTELANDQFLTTDFEAVGYQLAAISNGQWTATYRDECTTCDIYGRRFDSTGLPVTSALAAGDIGFPISTTQTTGAAMSAAASSGLNTLVFWDYTDTTGSPAARGIACRALNETGAAMATQATIVGPSENSDVVSATGLSNGNFAVVWQVFASPFYVARTAIVKSDCTLLGTVGPASTDTAVSAQRPNVTSNANTLLYSWIVPGATGGVRIRTAQLTGAFNGSETTLVANNTAQEIEHVRVSPWGTGFAVAVRWTSSSSTDGPGKIEVYRTNATGLLQGTPILITDKSRSDFASNKGFSIAERQDGALLVVWHVCETGPGLCDVFGRILRPTGAPVGDEFVIPTSVASEQINPSVIALPEAFVAAWNDSSGEAPDRSGTAVRARILYPVYDDARGIHGATCGASSPGAPACAEGLACAMGSDGAQRCYAKCTPPSCPGGGTCSTVDETTSACTF